MLRHHARDMTLPRADHADDERARKSPRSGRFEEHRSRFSRTLLSCPISEKYLRIIRTAVAVDVGEIEKEKRVPLVATHCDCARCAEKTL